MKRNPRKLKWTKTFRRFAGKEMTVDTTLQFAARRNVPVRYDRELVAKTLKAMELVSEIRARRERVFYKKRMAGKKARELELARKLVETHSHLLPQVRGSVKRRLAMEAQGGAMAVEMAETDKVELKPKSKVFGKMKKRQRVLVGGQVENEEDVEMGMSEGEEDEEDEGDTDMSDG